MMLNQRTTKQKQRTWWLMLLHMSMLVSGVGALAIARHFVLLQMSAFAPTQDHATALPWIQTASECRGEARVWDDGTCWDEQHDSSF